MPNRVTKYGKGLRMSAEFHYFFALLDLVDFAFLRGLRFGFTVPVDFPALSRCQRSLLTHER